jgi:hypothetical protein
VPNASTVPAKACALAGNVGLEDDVLRPAGAVRLVDLEAHDHVSAATDGPLLACKTDTGDGKPLALVGHDESVVLGLVEPEHLSSHRESFR